MSKHPLRIIPLGGLGEVGKNMMVYEYGGQILVVDVGIMFPDNDMLGVDYIIPDFNYLLSRRQQVAGVIITHGHEDHIGAIHHFVEEIQAPVYATPLTRGFLEVKLARHGLAAKTELKTVNAGEVVQIGPFRVEFFHVCHSVPDGVGLGIQTPEGLIVHTGDFKFDQTPVDNWPTDYAKLAEYSRRMPLALMCDSTNSERAGWTPSERVIDAAFNDVFRNAQGRIIIASFASLVSRMQQVTNAAVRYGRKLAFVGSSMVDNMKIARKLGYLEISDDVLVTLDQALNMDDNEVVIMCTGSQGEPSSILGRLSNGTYRAFGIRTGDTVVLSSHPIPGNEEDVFRTVNRLIRRGADVLYESIAQVHVSGHASQEEIKLMINLVKPRYFIPIHGEIRHLKQQARLAREVGIAPENIAVIENGQVIEFQDGEMHLGERVPGSYVFVDGAGVADVSRGVMRERETLSREGMVVVHLVLDDESGELREDPEIVSSGFMVKDEVGELLQETRQLISDIVSRQNGSLEKEVETVVREHLYSQTRRRPVIFVTVMRI